MDEQKLKDMMRWSTRKWTDSDMERKYWRYRSLQELSYLPLFTLAEACFYVQKDKQEVLQDIHWLRLRARRVNGCWIVPRSEVEKLYGVPAELLQPCPELPDDDETLTAQLAEACPNPDV